MNQFECWLEELRRFTGNYPLLTERTVLEAVCTVSKQKNARLVEKVVRIYKAVDVKEKFVGLIKNLIDTKAYFMACRMAMVLRIYEAYTIEDFIIPLLLQDKLPMVQEYLQENVLMQKQTIAFLDQYVKTPHRLLDFAL